MSPKSLAGLRAAMVCGALLWVTPALAQTPAPAPAEPPPDVDNEYRITAYPNYPLTEKLTGFGYVGWVAKPDADYDSIYLGTGTFYRPHQNIQLWLGLIGVWTNQEIKSNLLELRPFTGVKFMAANAKKWRYYNWTRYELRLTETRDSGDWTAVHRVRNQSRIDFPLTTTERAWTPKTFYAWTDVEPIWRSDTGETDPLRWRTGLGYIANSHLLVELQYYAQYTRPSGGGLRYTDNIFRLNFKVMTKRGLLPQKALHMLLDGGAVDD